MERKPFIISYLITFDTPFKDQAELHKNYYIDLSSSNDNLLFSPSLLVCIISKCTANGKGIFIFK